MTDILNRAPASIITAPVQQNEQKDCHSYIPEIIEENRVDPITSKTEVVKYVRGKLLGKVSAP